MNEFEHKEKILELLDPCRDEPDLSNHGCCRPGIDSGCNPLAEFEGMLASMDYKVACIARVALQIKYLAIGRSKPLASFLRSAGAPLQSGEVLTFTACPTTDDTDSIDFSLTELSMVSPELQRIADFTSINLAMHRPR
jgi:hypothetical protein